MSEAVEFVVAIDGVRVCLGDRVVLVVEFAEIHVDHSEGASVGWFFKDPDVSVIRVDEGSDLVIDARGERLIDSILDEGEVEVVIVM